MLGGPAALPPVVRTRTGADLGAGAQHPGRLEARAAHVPGLTVAVPATPPDAKGLLAAALRDSPPVLVAVSGMRHEALRGAETRAAAGASAQIVDPRAAILGSVERTGRLAIAHEARGARGVRAGIAAVAAGRAWRAPLRRVTSPFTPVPCSPPVEMSWLPGAARVVAAVREVLVRCASGRRCRSSGRRRRRRRSSSGARAGVVQ